MSKLNYFEGIRGLAAVFVVFSHFVQVFYPNMLRTDPSLVHSKYENMIASTPLNLLYNGSFAVSLFFVLSGFVLSHRYFKEKKNEVLMEGFIKRYFRLMIPVTVSLLFAYILMQFNAYYFSDTQSKYQG